MKNVVVALVVALAFYGCAHTYETEHDSSGRKILKGTITRNDLESDSEFQWFNENCKAYQPDTSVISVLKESDLNIHCILFLGTWCGDSKREVPKMFKVFDLLGIPASAIAMIGVDHEKKSIDDMPRKYSLSKVPTLIVFRGQEEIGRIEESPIQSVEIDLIGILHK